MDKNVKTVTLLVWLTQLGLSVAVPPVCAIWLAVWLHRTHGWGVWVVWVGVILGVYCAVDGLRVSLKALSRLGREDKKQPESISFNEHS